MFTIPEGLAASCAKGPDRESWLANLPEVLTELQHRWSVTLESPFGGPEVSCSWVARAARLDGTPAVLKVGMPHMEGEHEIRGLQFWNGDPTVRLLESDESHNAMLLERCEPGTPLRAIPEAEQDVVIAGLLRKLWRRPPDDSGFRPLSEMTAYWAAESEAASDRWPIPTLVREGLRLFEELPRTAPENVLLATDLHAGNVLMAERMPWLVIDPKPFAGDPAYDATQHLFNCDERMRKDPHGTIRRFADLLEVDEERVRLWTFARAAGECRDDWTEDSLSLARALAR